MKNETSAATPGSPITPDGNRDLDPREPVTPAEREDKYQRAAFLAAGSEIRKRKGMSQRDVAFAMGTTQSAVSDLESGRVEPQLGTLQRYARALDHRFDFAFLAENLPTHKEGPAGILFEELRTKALSPLFTALATQPERARTLDALESSVPLPRVLLSQLLTELQEKGWARNSTEKDQSVVYSLVDEAAYVIGVHLWRDQIVGVLMDLKKEVIKKHIANFTDSSRENIARMTVDVIDHLYRYRNERHILGVGVSIAGVVETESGRVNYAPDLQDGDKWNDVMLKSMLEKGICDRIGNDRELRVVVENDANALALDEYQRRGDQSVAVILHSGVGIGAGLVLGGRLVAGAHSAAGEGGHIIIDPSGPACRVGLDHKGCLETMASAEGILLTLHIPADTTAHVADGLPVASELVRNGDRAAAQAFQSAGDALGHFVSRLVVLLDPGRIVIYAHPEMVQIDYASARAFRKGIRNALQRDQKSHLIFVRNPLLEYHPLKETTGAIAAGAAAVRQFLASPSHWAPSLDG